MRLPVSRDLYDALRADYQALLDKYHALKLSGATAIEAAPTLEREEPDAITQAITTVCGSDKRLRGAMAKQAMRDRAVGRPDDEIVQSILRGVPDDLGVPA